MFLRKIYYVLFFLIVGFSHLSGQNNCPPIDLYLDQTINFSTLDQNCVCGVNVCKRVNVILASENGQDYNCSGFYLRATDSDGINIPGIGFYNPGNCAQYTMTGSQIWHFTNSFQQLSPGGNIEILVCNSAATLSDFEISFNQYTGGEACSPTVVAVDDCDSETSITEINAGSTYYENPCEGVILTSPNGNCFLFTVNDNGEFLTTEVECPVIPPPGPPTPPGDPQPWPQAYPDYKSLKLIGIQSPVIVKKAKSKKTKN